MAGRLLLRAALLSAGPLAALTVGAGGALLAFTLASSLAAVAGDALRQRRKCLPFPIYLLLVYALQSFSLLALPTAWGGAALGGAAPEGFRREGARAALRGSGAAAATPAPSPRIQTMAVVMAAHNEHRYMKRTLDSIYGRTPAEVLKEIIVVDDASDPPLAPTLREFPQVRLIRHEERRGLIKSKTEGGNLASADMIMFLDAHVKPEPGWWQPILRHMNANYRRVVVPVIPILDAKTWEPNLHAVGIKMMFDWKLFFNWFEDHSDLVPCMSGGLFGITRRWWHESGEYDYGMQMWGAENIEQSIRIWLCGGEIYVARDSRVSHVFRSSFPYRINNTEIYINKVRTVETWFDEYRELYYTADPAARQFVPYVGNISERLALKQRLQCKPFRWYVEKFRGVFTSKRMLPEDVFLFRDRGNQRCLQISSTHQAVHEAACDRESKMQQWVETHGGKAFRSIAANRCLQAPPGGEGAAQLLPCSAGSAEQEWGFHAGRLTWQGRCLQGRPEGLLELSECAGSPQGSGDFEVYARHLVAGPGSL